MKRLPTLRSGLLIGTLLPLLANAAPSDEWMFQTGDMLQVRQLFQSRQFSKLETLLNHYQTQCEQDIRWEIAVDDGFSVFASENPSIRALLDEWVQHSPTSWCPLLARATYFQHLARKARGGKYANETSSKQFEEMENSLNLALRDLHQALQLQPHSLEAHLLLMKINLPSGNQEQGIALANQALEQFPDSYLIRQCHMLSLLPRWGGSYEAMEQFAQDSALHFQKNPFLKELGGMIDWDQANLMGQANLERKIELYQKALSHGDNLMFLKDLSDTYLDAKRNEQAMQIAQRAVSTHPNRARAYLLRAQVFFAQEQWSLALKDIQKMEEITGAESEEVILERRRTSKNLMLLGHELFKADGKHAIELYTESIEFWPQNSEAYCWRGNLRRQRGDKLGSLNDLQQAIKLNPHLFDAYLGLDQLLFPQGKLDEIVEAWSKFLELEPDHAQAHLERAGTYYHKRNFAAALLDAKRACELNNAAGCLFMKQLQSQPSAGSDGM